MGPGTVEGKVSLPPEAPEMGDVQPEAGRDPEKPAPYWVSVCVRTKKRKLHRNHGCGTFKWQVREVVEIHHLLPDCADSYCLTCWPRKSCPKAPWESSVGLDGAEEVSDADSSDSSS
jgi:hypothetical protein